MEKLSYKAFACLFLLCVVQVNGYSRYGRSCKDIGCLSHQKCVIVNECEGGKCGYPTCKPDNSYKRSCQTMTCGGGQHCVTENGSPKCVDYKPISGYDSAGVSVINGHRTPTANNDNNNNTNHGYVSTNTNPYANANAPPIDEPGRNDPISSSTNLGYPPYPATSNNNGHAGSNPSPSPSGTNLGYPPYPTINRMPMPGQTGVYQQHPPPPQAGGFYPGNHASGYPQYPTNQQYPSHSNYPYQTRNYNSNAHYPRYRSASDKSTCAQLYHVLLATLALAITTRYLS